MNAEILSVISQILSLLLAVTCLWFSQSLALKRDWGIGRVILLSFMTYAIVRGLIIIFTRI